MSVSLLLILLLLFPVSTLLAQQPPPATVTNLTLNATAPQRSTVTSIALEFSADVAAYLHKEHLILRNLTTGQTVDPAVFDLNYDPATHLATWTFPTLPAKSLAEGNYLAVLKADALLAPLANRTVDTPGLGLADSVFTFHRRFGDSEGDRDVDFLDTARLRTTWNKPAAAPEYLREFDANLDGTVNVLDLNLFRQNYFTFFPPVAAIHASLFNDTGLSTSDGLTSDPTVTGIVFRPNPNTTFRAGLSLSTAPAPVPLDTTADLDADGTFLFTPARLAQIKGSPLDPGAYKLHLETVESGAVSSFFDLLFTLGGAAPCDLTPEAGWTTTISPPTNLVPNPVAGSVTFANCEALLREGDSFQVTLERTFTIPQNAGLLAITYEAPTFDTSATRLMRDAFEAALVDATGRPLTFTIQGAAGITPASSATPIVLPATPDAFFNHSDGNAPFSAPGAASVPLTLDPQHSTIFLDVRDLPAGSTAHLILRLVNNDRDRATTVRINEVKFKSFDNTLNLAGSPSTALSLVLGAPPTGSLGAAAQSLDPRPPLHEPKAVSGARLFQAQAPSAFTAFFDDLSGFDLAAGNPPVLVDFDQIAPGTDVSGMTFQGMTVNRGNQPNPSAPLIVVRGSDTFTPGGSASNRLFATSGQNVLSPGGTQLALGPNPLVENDDLEIVFAQPVFAIGFDVLFQSLDGQSYASIEVLGQQGQSLYSNGFFPIGSSGGGGGHAFVGFSSLTPSISKIVINEYDENDANPDANIGFDTFRLTLGPQDPMIAAPTLAVVSPQDNARQAAPGTTLLTGYALADTPLVAAGILANNRIILVTVNGQPVDALDPNGNFFSAIEIRAGANLFTVVATDAYDLSTTTAITVYGVTNPENFSTLGVVSGSVVGDYGRTTFHERTRTLYADLAVRNAGSYPIRAPLYVGIANISDPSVRLLGTDGVSADGIPYYDYSSTLTTGSLTTGNLSLPRTLAFYNPNHVQFRYDLVVLGQLNQAPYFTTTPALEAVPTRAYSYPSHATDPDGDTLTYSLLEGPAGLTIATGTGLVSWTPTAAQLGNHDVRIRADDGKGGLAEQHYIISVITAPANRPPFFTSSPVTVATVANETLVAPSNFAPGQIFIASSTYQKEVRIYDAESLAFVRKFSHPLFAATSYSPRGMVFNERGNLVCAARAYFVEFSDYGVEYARYPKQFDEPTENLVLDRLGNLYTTTETGASNRLNQYRTQDYTFAQTIALPAGSGSLTGITFDSKGRLYVGSQADAKIYVLQADDAFRTFTFLKTIPAPNSVEGLQFNQNGELIAAGGNGGSLVRYNPETGQVLGNFDAPQDFWPVPVTVDNAGRIFTADFENGSGTSSADLIRFSPDGSSFVAINDPNLHGPFGLALPATKLPGGPVQPTYTYDSDANDPDYDPLTYSLVTGPAGFSLNPITGAIRWAPTIAQVGIHNVSIKVDDGRGGTATQSYQVRVLPGDGPPVIVHEPVDLTVSEVDPALLTVDGQSLLATGSVSARVTNGGPGVTAVPFDVLFFEDRNLNKAYDPAADTVLGRTRITASLAANQSQVVTAAVQSLVQFSGAPVWAFVDSSNAIAETNELNNLARPDCQAVPVVGQFDPVIEWQKSTFSIRPASKQIIITPAVIDLDGNGVPDIVFSTYESTSGANGVGCVLRAVRGDNGNELWTVTNPTYEPHFSGGVAAGDIDGDGKPEIIAVRKVGSFTENALMAVEHDGTPKWISPAIWGGVGAGYPSIADLEGDGTPEIIIGGTVLNNDGTIRWEGNAVGGLGKANIGFGPLSIVADLDLDGAPEVVAGKSAYRANGALYWNSTIPDGFPAVGNFDADPNPEIAVVSSGAVYLLEHTGQVKWGPIAIPGGGRGGPPTVADIDGDGVPEIGLAGASRYVVLAASGAVKWQQPVQDGSSNFTGSSVFDFDGDGQAEVVYGDELYLRIYRGRDGTILYQLPKSSGTGFEYPVIADVDGDGNAEIVAVANTTIGFGPQFGLYVIGDRNDTWVSTRKIWNQHSYHITNINDDGTIPRYEENSWQKHNTYRLNLQPDGGALDAPDLVPSFVRVSGAGSTTAITVRVGNGGIGLAPSALPVALYNGDPLAGGTLLGTGVTTGILPPGTFEDVTITVANPNTPNLWVVADDDGTGRGKVRECDENNNFYLPGQNLPLNNQPPRITSTPMVTATEGSAYQYDVEATDADAGDTLTYSLAFAPTGMTIADDTGLIRWTPGERDGGAAAVQVKVTDSRGATALQNYFITVADALNGSPEFVSTAPTTVAATDSYSYFPTTRDPDGGAPTFDLVTSPDGMIVEADTGSLAWRPLLGQIGVHDVILRVQDGRGGVALQSFQINVTPPGSAPVITSLPPGPATVAMPYRYLVRAQDADGDALTFTLGAGAPGGMTLVAEPTNPNAASLEWTPVLAQLGTHPITIVVRDPGGAEGVQTFNLEVVASGQNRAPVFTSTPRTKTRLDLPYVYLVKATDADGDALSFQLVAGPGGMVFDAVSASEKNARLLRWSPTPQDLGSHPVTIRVTDGRGGTADQAFTLEVATTLDNAPPQIVSNPPLHATSEQPYEYNLVASDPDGDDVTWRLVSGPVGMSLDPLTGALRWFPSLAQLGANSVTVEAKDSLQATATQTWTIEVGAVNGPPNITSVPPTIAQTGAPYLYAPRASDPDGDKLAWSLVANPIGMTIDAATGLLRWTPSANQTGATLVTLRVSDGRGGTDSQTYTLTASDVKANKSPVIVSTPPRGTTAQRPYSYAVRATDPDGDTLTLSLLAAPAGATITTTASVKGQVDGLISWIPTAAQEGQHEFIVSAKDPSNASASQRYFVTVRPNAPPVIVSTPPSDAVPTVASRYDVQATDPNGDALTYALTQAPAGMSIDNLGRIVWNPTLNQLGSHPVSVTVSDGFGGSATQAYTMTVGADTVAPTVSLVVGYNLQDAQGNKYVRADTQVPLTVNAADNVGVTLRELRLDGVALALNESGGTVATFPAVGFVQAVAIARDASGNEGQATVSIPVIDPNAESTVTIAIHSPLNEAAVTTIANVTGTITSQIPLRDYTVDFAELTSEAGDLEIAVDDPSLEFQQIARVTLPPNTLNVTNALLGKFDPTMLHNGGYLIRVTAFDINGKGRREGVVVNVTGNLKLGEFRLEFPDLTVPLVGIPIEIKRIYDSRDAKKKGDFGYGWTLGLQNARILEVGKKPFAGLGGDGTTFTTKTRVYLTAPDGRRIGFKHTPILTGAGLFGAFYRPAFTSDPGIYDKLEAVPSEGAYQIRSDGSLAGGFGLVELDPQAYRLTTRDNLKYDYDQNFGLQKVTDLNGNTIVFTRDGIRHSSGVEIKFTRDAQGRITKITDPAGKDLLYTYDAAGDLATAADRTALVTQFRYLSAAQRAHYVDEIIDPLGRRAVKTEYGPDGRVVAVIDALGNRQEQNFVPEQLTGARTDARGNVTELVYDTRGNLTQEKDPEGGIKKFEYNDPANPDKETKIIDPNGHATSYAFDARGNTTSITDAAGSQTAVAFNGQNKATQVTNPLGQKLNLSYDAQGALLEAVHNAGFRTTVTRDAQGRMTSLTDAAGNTTLFDYTAACPCGKPGKVINPDGSFRLFEYNGFGQTTREVDELGHATLSFYDDEGRLTETRDSLGNRTTYAYTGGNKTSQTDPLGRVTRYDYDSNNKQTKITDAEGGIVQFEYDANGNRTKVIDPVGNATTFVFDRANRLKEEINVFGNKRTFAYDAVGNRIEGIDRNARRRTFEFDELNRMTKEKWWNDATLVRTIEYAFNALGAQTLATDPAARFDYTYDGLNHLQRVAQSATPGQPNFTLIYAYTPRGQVALVTDNYGVNVGSTYDSRNRLGSRTWQGPGIDPARVDFTYDTVGNRTRADRYADLAGTQRIGFTTHSYNATNLLGNITHSGPAGQALGTYGYEFDAANQITKWTINSQPSTFTYDATSQLTGADHTAQPDESYSYDRNGSRTGNGYTVGGDNQISADATFDYGYDAEGNMTSRTNRATGATTLYTFDHRNRLVSAEDRDPSNVVTQTVGFVYDAMNRRISKVLNGRITRFLYNQNDSWADLDDANGIIARYLYGAWIDEFLARQRATDGRGWYLTDHLGTVRDIANATGAVVAHVDYTSFGQVLSVSNAFLVDRFRFTGREFDEETNLYYYRLRYYDPRIGKFIQHDPLGFAGGDMNLNRYVLNIPIQFRDPFGQNLIAEYTPLINKVIATASLAIVGTVVATSFLEIVTCAIAPDWQGVVDVLDALRQGATAPLEFVISTVSDKVVSLRLIPIELTCTHIHDFFRDGISALYGPR